jgi:RHS repeat-associated protein
LPLYCSQTSLTETIVTPLDIPVGTYLESGGQVVLEAESFVTKTTGLSHDWQLKTSQSGYTGTGYLQALPDIDIPLVVPTGEITGSPTTSYPIRFTTPGTYTVWTRGYPPNAAGDSLYVGLNGQLVNVTGGAPGQWDWANQQTPDGQPATLSIGASGLYTLTTSMREDGFRLDRLLLTTSTTYLPASFGPAESARQTSQSPIETTTLTRTIVYTYDNLSRLTGASYATGESFGYTYDGLGNQTTLTETVATNTVVTTYTYNALNQLVTAHASGDGITWYYTFDATGNQTRQTPGGATAAEGEIRYSYDAANRLTRVELYTGGSYTTLSTALYNGDGERTSLTTYALGVPLTTTYAVFAGQLLATTTGTQTTLYLPGRETVLAEYGSEWSYPLNDPTGSLRQTATASGGVTLARSYKPFGGMLEESGPYQSLFGFVGAQLDRVSGLLYANGRYYDPATGRYLTPDYSRVNPYTPLQGPGIWLLLPFMGMVLALRRRRGGPWRMVVLVCVIGMGMTLTGCSLSDFIEKVPKEGSPTSTLPQPPSPAVSLPTSTQTSTPTSTPPLLSTSTSTPLPPPTPSPTLPPPVCPTPSDTPTPTDTPSLLSLDKMRITREDVDNAGGSVITYLRGEDEALIATRVAIGEASNSLDKQYVLWIIRKRIELGFWGSSANDVVLAEGQFHVMANVKTSDNNNNPFYPEYIAITKDKEDDLRRALTNRQPFNDFNNCSTFSDILHVCNDEARQQEFRNTYAEAVTILNSPISLVPDPLRGYDSFLSSDNPEGEIFRTGGLGSRQLAGGNVYNDQFPEDNNAGY